MKVLITGGAGFVGRWFTKYCLDSGYEVEVIDNLVKGGGGKAPKDWPLYDPYSFSGFQFKNVDTREFFKESSPNDYQLIIHLAAVVGGRLSIENDPLAVAEDLAIDSLFWKWLAKGTAAHVVTFSSSAAYPVSLQGTDGFVVLSETDIDFSSNLGMPDLTYGWAKLTNEYLGRLAHEQYGLKVACYRPFSGYGEDQDLSYPFPSICKRAIENKGAKTFMVWGSGKQGRDFIHISDVVRAVMETYGSITDGSAINICTGTLTTFEQLALLACESVGYSPEIVGDTSMPAGVFARVGNPRVLSELGFVPKVTLAEGVAAAIKYLAQV